MTPTTLCRAPLELMYPVSARTEQAVSLAVAEHQRYLAWRAAQPLQ